MSLWRNAAEPLNLNHNFSYLLCQHTLIRGFDKQLIDMQTSLIIINKLIEGGVPYYLDLPRLLRFSDTAACLYCAMPMVCVD